MPLHLRVVAAALALGSCASPVPPAVPPAPAEVSEPVPEPPPCLRIARIEVAKAERRLRAFCDGGRVMEMTVALGREAGPKRVARDWRTPEGEYRISGPARRSRFHLFVPIDYPSLADAASARLEGRIPEPVYRSILRAHERGEPPPLDTALGGHLGFHGEGERWRGDSVDLDWTYGCVALSDADIDFLVERIEVGTPVRIAP